MSLKGKTKEEVYLFVLIAEFFLISVLVEQ
jgi:hypothetical protein